MPPRHPGGYGVEVSDSFVVPARYCGPPRSGNGGWTSGHLAQLVADGLDASWAAGERAGSAAAAVTVRLRTPPPLDTEMTVTYADDATVEIWDGEDLVAQAYPAEPLDHGDLPAPATFEQALACGAAYEGLERHPFPTCFACGTERDPEDALCLRTGPLPGRSPVRAAAWVPREVTPEVVWAALDCPGAWASGIAGREMVLGTMTASVRALPAVGEPHLLMAWPRDHSGRSGRTLHSGTALYDGSGRLLAHAQAIWIAVDAAKFRR